MKETIIRTTVPVQQRLSHTAKRFGLDFPVQLEPTVYAFADRLAETYNGGYWEFYTLSNGGFYMAPKTDDPFSVSCENGYEGELSADALGITVCLYAYSHLSFSHQPSFAQRCAQHYHWLRDYMMEHREAGSMLAAVD